MIVLAIDPGTTESGWVRFDGRRVIESGVFPNSHMLGAIHGSSNSGGADVLAIEWIESFGMAVGKEVFETVRWVGRFQQAWREPEAVKLVTRREVKLHLCGSMKAKDPNLRQALLDKLGPIGVKAKPGPLYGVKRHAWSALAVAVTAMGV